MKDEGCRMKALWRVTGNEGRGARGERGCFKLTMSGEQEGECLLDDRKGYLFTNEPLCPGDRAEDKVHDRPEETPVNGVSDHGRGRAEMM